LKSSMNTYFNQDQIEYLCGKRVKWSSKTVRQGLILKYKLGQRFYQNSFSKKIAPFPSATTLNSRIQQFKIKPGVLEAKLEKVPLRHRSVGLVFDEKAIIPSLKTPSNQSLDYDGIVTLKPSKAICAKEGENIKAKNALVVLAAGMNIREKELVGLQYTAGCTDGEAMKDFLFQIVKEIEKNQMVFVDWLGFDMGPSNTSFLNACGISTSSSNIQYKIQHPVRENAFLFLKPDDVHNKKNLVNALRKNDFVFSASMVELFNLNSNKISFKEVTKIYKFQENTDMKPARQLKQENISPNNFEKMKERVAYEVFSSDIIMAINFTDKKASENDKKNATAVFLKILSIFHTITSNSTGWSIKNSSKYDDDIEFLQWFIDDFLPNIRTPTALKCIPAIQMSIRSLIDLSKMYFDLGYEVVIPSWFLSNCIENIFSMVTDIFKKPTSTNMNTALRIISVRQFQRAANQEASNYSYDKTNSDTDFLKLLNEFMHIEAENIEETESIASIRIEITDEITFEELFKSDIEKNIFQFEMAKILTKAMKSIECVTCQERLIDMDKNENAHNQWLKEKQEVHGEHQNLLYPSRDMMRYFLRLEFVFQQLSKVKTAHDLSFLQDFITNANDALVPDEHCFTSTSKLIITFIRGRLRLKLVCHLPHKALKHASKSLN
jgi:Transposase protein